MVSGSGGTTSDLFMNFKDPSPRTEMKKTMEVNNQTGFFVGLPADTGLSLSHIHGLGRGIHTRKVHE